jgi:poly(3-hydroxyoctanoate) depolymerase
VTRGEAAVPVRGEAAVTFCGEAAGTFRGEAAEPQVGILRTGGLQVSVRTQGAGPALLLLNGLTRPSASWAALIGCLTGRQVVTFDVPGVGGSPSPAAPLSIPAVARLATKVLDAAGVDSADVLGFSHGGLVAQQLAVSAPRRVRRLVLAATSCGVGGTPGQFLSGALAPVEGLSCWPGPDAVTVLWQILAVGAWSSIPFLGAIRQPTLVVQGATDRLVPPENGSMLARRIPAARLVTIATGHDMQRIDSAGLLASAVNDFLSGRP